MNIYIVERDTPSYRPVPEVFVDGKKAFETVKKEYNSQMEELGTSQEIADAGDGFYGCYWNFDGTDFCGDCMIDADCGVDRWEWRITKHEIPAKEDLIEKTGYIRKFDDLGRILIPGTVRQRLGIKSEQAMEILSDKEGHIILRQYNGSESNA